MLVICAGPNILFALKKTKELVDGFRKKYDPSGFSYERLQDTNMAIVLNKMSTPTFFATKRMIRVDGLIDASKIADIRLLAKRLISDAGQTVVLTYEAMPVSQKILNEFQKNDIIQYDYPLLSGASFTNWCIKRGDELDVQENISRKISDSVLENMLLAEQELQKASANPKVYLEKSIKNINNFDRSDMYLRSSAKWKEILDPIDDEALAIFISQARSAIRVSDASFQDVHPYVVKKLSEIQNPENKNIFLKTIKTLVSTRTGNSDISETEILL